jgi:hypothetical protein
MLFQTGEAYSKLDLTKVTYSNKKLSKVEKEKSSYVRVPTFLVTEKIRNQHDGKKEV